MSDQVNKTGAGNEATMMSPSCANGKLYTIKAGDTLYQIARMNNIPLQMLISANPQITDPNVIYPGQVICIPGGGGVPMPQCPAGSTMYRVVAGDTLYSIATRNGITLNALVQANPQITNPNLIYPGQEICIPKGGGTVTCVNGSLYTVVAGDTMYEIARRNNLTLAVLLAANPQVTDPDLIFPGQVICIPQMATIVPPIAPPIVVPPVVPPVMPPVMPPMPPVMPYPPVQPPCAIPVEPPVRPPMPPVMPPVVMPVEPPLMPYPPVQPPCTMPGDMPVCYQPMPVWMRVNWDECPYHCKGKKHHKKHHCK